MRAVEEGGEGFAIVLALVQHAVDRVADGEIDAVRFLQAHERFDGVVKANTAVIIKE